MRWIGGALVCGMVVMGVCGRVMRGASEDALIIGLGTEKKENITAEVVFEGAEFEGAMSPGKISVEVKGGNLGAVAGALSEAMKTPLATYDLAMGKEDLFTISEQERNFWEVMLEVNRQHPVHVDGIRQYQLHKGTPGWRYLNPASVGGFAVAAKRVSRHREADPQEAPEKQVGTERVELAYEVIADPRVVILRHSYPDVNRVEDDLGNVLVNDPYPAVWKKNLQDVEWRRGSIDGSLGFGTVKDMGTRIEKAEGYMRVMVLVSGDEVVVENLEGKVGEKIVVGGRTVVFEQAEVKEGKARIAVRAEGPAATDGGRGTGVVVQVVDSGNREVFSTVMRRERSEGDTGLGYVGPLKARLIMPKKVAAADVTFAMRVLPLP